MSEEKKYDFMVDDKVTWLDHGVSKEGIIEEIEENEDYPITVRFCHDIESFNSKGEYLKNRGQVLFHGHGLNLMAALRLAEKEPERERTVFVNLYYSKTNGEVSPGYLIFEDNESAQREGVGALKVGVDVVLTQEQYDKAKKSGRIYKKR